MNYDKIILGAGLYGLYSAVRCGEKGQKVLVLECDSAPFMRATYINQARVHMGYHYPRSYSTAVKSARYFERFCKDFGFCLHEGFDQIYATSTAHSWTDAAQFRRFCRAAGIPCEKTDEERYFRPGLVDGAFLTKEYTYDAQVLKEHLLQRLAALPGVSLRCGVRAEKIERLAHSFCLTVQGERLETPYLLNATYAGVNEVLCQLGYETFSIKYELCEIILCSVPAPLKNVGITVMDGPFFSIMPFGQTGLHSLTSVAFTPHKTSYDALPAFDCQPRSGGYCAPGRLGNCDLCPQKPKSAWPYMSRLARKYLRDELGFQYEGSLFSMKPILKASEIDDSRPTLVRKFSDDPVFVSVLSGKINTVYDLEEVLGL